MDQKDAFVDPVAPSRQASVFLAAGNLKAPRGIQYVSGNHSR